MGQASACGGLQPASATPPDTAMRGVRAEARLRSPQRNGKTTTGGTVVGKAVVILFDAEVTPLEPSQRNAASVQSSVPRRTALATVK
jgi:hypothetical protein